MASEVAGNAAQDADILTPERLVREARRSIAARRAITAHLPAAFVPDPALDILKALYVAQAEERGMSRRELCAQTTIVANVAARWLGALAADALIVEQAGEVRLTPHGLAVIEAGLKAVISASHDLD